MFRIFVLLCFGLGLSACANATRDLEGPFEPLGNFRLGHSEVVAPNLEKLLISREASKEEWIRAVDEAVELRFRRFEGSKFYHFGISVEAYSLPPPVVPGKSAVAMRLTVWDDATATKMNDETKVISVIKVFESRLSMSRERQIEVLAADAAKAIETWLREQQAQEGWFAIDPEEEAAIAAAAAALEEAEDAPAPAPEPAPELVGADASADLPVSDAPTASGA